jgi:1,4-dihydroxy-2-naphthoate octaprenyltransferase
VAVASLSDAAPAPGSLAAWRLAARLRTLPVAAAPVAVGAACAAREGAFTAPRAGAALAAALLLQLGANFANDAFDHARGADGPDRLGPPRAAALGLLSPRALHAGTGLAFAGATLAGAYLAWVAGWVVVAIGVAGMAAALGYVGPGAYGYRGGGELAVFLFFGLVAVAGTAFVQTGTLSGVALAAGVPLGALAAAVLVVNNVRDLDGDRRAGKRTLAVRLGPRGARAEYAVLVAAAYASVAALAGRLGAPAVLLPLLTLPGAVAGVRAVRSGAGPALNPVLARTARLELAFAASLAVGLLV